MCELAAAYFWRGLDGALCLDSCGIFVLKRPGQYVLEWPLATSLHAKDPTGVLFKAKSVICDRHVNRHPTAAAERPDEVHPPTFRRHKIAGGPGQKIEC